jgi:DNA-binding HxlR family transcriptional regulator
VTRRWYDDACGTALAMELVGERWSLLIVRELMFGPRRFADLKRGVPGISANVLTQRLEGLAAAGILRRRRLPAPVSADAYDLTPFGYASEPAIQALGRWAVTSPLHDPRLPLSPASLMMSFRTMYTGNVTGQVGFDFGAETFIATLADTIEIARADPASAEAAVAGAPEMVAAWIYGGAPLAGLDLQPSGDRALLDRFARAFPLPAKFAPPG